MNTAIDATVIELALPIASPPDDPILAVGSSSYPVLAETEPDHEDVTNDVHEWPISDFLFSLINQSQIKILK